MERTESVRKELPHLIREFDCKTVLDIPCGDFHWMSSLALDVDYVGADIVGELIEKNQARYGGARLRFLKLDMMSDELPRVDIIFCRDCWVHLSNEAVMSAIRNVKRSGGHYILTTTFLGTEENADILTGEWRKLNLQLPPFEFLKPVRLISESLPEGDYADKYLGLWKISDLPA